MLLIVIQLCEGVNSAEIFMLHFMQENDTLQCNGQKWTLSSSPGLIKCLSSVIEGLKFLAMAQWRKESK